MLKETLFLLLFVPLTLCGQDNPSQPQHIKSIYFGGGSYYIDYEQIMGIQEFLNAIPQIETYSITIHSHTDNIGGVEFNNWLSEMRSTSVAEQLINNSIQAEMIEIKDFGLFNPVYDNSTLEGRIKNRRVDIILHPMVF